MIEDFFRERIAIAQARTNTNTGSTQQISPIRFTKCTQYNDGTDSGWLRVKLDRAINGSTNAFLCEMTKVLVTRTQAGRTYFKIEDGTYAGKSASLNSDNADLYLTTTGPTASSNGATLEVTYSGQKRAIYSTARGIDIDQKAGRLGFNGNTATISLSTVEADSLGPLPDGTYDILVPDVAHDIGYTGQYKPAYPDLKCHQVWFPIEYQTNNRYVHVGAISEGCVTVLDLGLWNDIYDYLISHRQTDRRYVGKLIIRKV